MKKGKLSKMRNFSFWVQFNGKTRKELVTIAATKVQTAWELITERFEDEDVTITERSSL
jgi:hypothetical protein|tara:strand:+ start:1000 stop:1176 length:177 start_codon:yes stop_codon:yes gene_type:complete